MGVWAVFKSWHNTARPSYPGAMPPQHLTLIPMAPADATLDVALYGATYRLTGEVAGQRVFWFDLSPTYAVDFDRVVTAAAQGEDASMTATVWRSGLSSAGGVLTVHAEQSGKASGRADWALGPDAAAQLKTWIDR